MRLMMPCPARAPEVIGPAFGIVGEDGMGCYELAVAFQADGGR